ncbi:MmgE/PrpD family protein [Sphingomonas sp. AOB5]|uniref:MmgE/PrpD family protein n=1 Tax=Sphingomonas sp. AOB5 TaxID=3034017 RepID=UPI0023F99E67|nr:MmgE/PrpD family protein [Sphingomonas sp. AOB5]MDF7776341.1 MmgE/PrpD family protein [Sphingomonas sp. AOB5]
MTNLSARIADHVTGIRYEDLPPATVEATIRSLVDAMGVMLAASSLGEGTAAFADLALENGGPAQARLIGRAGHAPLLAAALANGALAHAVDFEDAFDGAPTHPNAAQVPAALALAETLGGVSGQDFITAIAVGCDLVCRMGLALIDSPDKFGFYPPPLLGAFGAVAACARIAGLTSAQTVDAFSLLLCSHNCSAELKYSPHSTVRAVRDSFAAQAAVQAVLLAKRGVRGFDAPIEGKAGFYALYARGGYDPAPILDGLGTRFYGEQLSFKPWPSCRGTHSAIEAIIAHAPDPDSIESVTITAAPFLEMLFEPAAQKQRPQTAIDAKFSLPFTVATAAIHGEVTLDSFTPEALADPRLHALAERVSFVPEAGSADLTAATIDLRFADGTAATHRIVHPLGHPSNPLTDAALDEKFRMCAALALVPPDIEGLLAALRGLRTLPDVADLPH